MVICKPLIAQGERMFYAGFKFLNELNQEDKNLKPPPLETTTVYNIRARKNEFSNTIYFELLKNYTKFRFVMRCT